jgi:hypothetical protein
MASPVLGRGLACDQPATDWGPDLLHCQSCEDKCFFFESSFLPKVEKLAPELTTVRHFVLMVGRTAMPATSIPNIQCL